MLNLDTKNSVGVRVKRINFISEVTKEEPFVDGEKVVSIIDIDGVLCEYGRKNNADDNVSRFLGLRKVIAGSDKVMFNSSRINLDEDGFVWDKMLRPVFGRKSIPRCPFMTKSGIERLEKFSKMANPDCEVEFNISPKKMIGCYDSEDRVMVLAEETLRQDKKLVIIGSSIFDLMITRQVNKAMKEKELKHEDIYTFDTGHVLI